MRENSSQLIKICATLKNPATETKSVGLPADALPLFFARRLDYFIMTKNSQSLPGLGTVKTVSS
jgi:hypothetical protein